MKCSWPFCTEVGNITMGLSKWGEWRTAETLGSYFGVSYRGQPQAGRTEEMLPGFSEVPCASAVVC